MVKKQTLIVFAGLLLIVSSCERREPQSRTGIGQAKATVRVQASGLTVEQENIRKRIELENVPGSIKHLYVLSAYSGQVLIYSTVQGKVTSSGKRLTPYEVVVDTQNGIPPGYNFDNSIFQTAEVLQDDGTYGSSAEYLYWFDSQGRYHQHYVSGGQIIHVSDQPLPVKSITLNLEVTSNE